MGDFVKGRLDQLPQLSPRLREGIRLHRAIDTYSDRHPVFRRSRARLRPPLRRYGGIIIDVFYDHYLARRWEDYSPLPLPVFCRSVYAHLQSYYHAMPTPMRHSVRRMSERDWLGSYRDIDGVARALAGIEKRLKRPSGLRLARHDLEHHYAALGDDFRDFFSDLLGYASTSNGAAADR